MEELIYRISLLNNENKAQWGKMTIFQIVTHNNYWNNWILNNEYHFYKQELLGKIFGNIV